MLKEVTLVANATPFTAVIRVRKEDLNEELKALRARTSADENYDVVLNTFYEELLVEGVNAKSNRKVSCVQQLTPKPDPEADTIFAVAGLVWFEPVLHWKPGTVELFAKLFLTTDPASEEAVTAELKTIRTSYRMKNNKIRKVDDDYAIKDGDTVQVAIHYEDGSVADAISILEGEEIQEYMKPLRGTKKSDKTEVVIPIDLSNPEGGKRKATMEVVNVMDLPEVKDWDHLAKLMKAKDEADMRKRLGDTLVMRRTSGFSEVFEQFVRSSANMDQPPIPYLQLCAEQDLNRMLAVHKEVDLLRTMRANNREELLARLLESASSRYVQQLGALYLVPYLGIKLEDPPELESGYTAKYRHEYQHQLKQAMMLLTKKVMYTTEQDVKN